MVTYNIATDHNDTNDGSRFVFPGARGFCGNLKMVMSVNTENHIDTTEDVFSDSPDASVVSLWTKIVCKFCLLHHIPLLYNTPWPHSSSHRPHHHVFLVSQSSTPHTITIQPTRVVWGPGLLDCSHGVLYSKGMWCTRLWHLFKKHRGGVRSGASAV